MKYFEDVMLFQAFDIFAHFVEIAIGLAMFIGMAVAGYFFYRKSVKESEKRTLESVEASRLHLATVEALATAIDARDQVGSGHVRRVQIYAVGMGEAMGLSAELIQTLRTGALLHDIGKLAVPDHILNKPGRLTPAEMEKTKIHPVVGASILEKVHFPYPVIPTIKHHHEMWDGNGYPDKLKGEQIPLTARIISVADAYDTLRGSRPYRVAVSKEEARRYLLSGAGSQFDPKLVDIFLRNLHNFEREIEAQGLSYSFESKDESMYVAEGNTGKLNQSYIEQIKRANREVYTLYELARIFSSSLNLADTLKLFVKKIHELIPFDTCAVYILDEAESTAVIQYVEGKNKHLLQERVIKIGQGATGYVLKNRQPVYTINPALDFSFYQAEGVSDYTSMASLPLLAEERLIGAVSLYSCGLESYEDEHMRLLETVSRIAADAISKALYHAETESRAMTDPMTNLPNARNLQMQFEREVARSKRTGHPFQVMMLDLDGFKKVNDTFGHKVGDVLLREVSRVMRKQLRDYDFLARYAGDEFVAIVPEMSNDEMKELIQRMEVAVKELEVPTGDGRFAGVGVSIGHSSYPKDGETLDQVLVAADNEMYSVKAKHKEQAKIPRPIPVSEDEFIMEFTHEDSQQTSSIPTLSTTDLLEFDEVSKPYNPSSSQENYIVELDESHIISNSVN